LDLGRPYTYTGTVDGSIAHVHTDYPSRWFNSLILERPSVVSLAGLNMGGNTRARKKLTRRNKKQLQHQSSTTKGGKTKIEALFLSFTNVRNNQAGEQHSHALSISTSN
jgi:hypothetical protein